MRKIKYSVLVLLILCTNIVFAAETNIMFEKANQLYHNKYYDSAAQLYQHMIEDGYCHADLYYNAGNAYYRSNKTGMAVWCFKKALQMDNNRNYRDNLLLAQKKIKNNIKPDQEIFFIRWWKNTYNMMSVNKWAMTTLILFLVSIFLLVLKNIMQKKSVSKGVVNVFMTLTFFCLFFLGVKYYNDTYHYRGILVKDIASFKTSAKSAPVTLGEGTEAEYVSSKNNRLMIRLPDGRVGEIPKDAFRKL